MTRTELGSRGEEAAAAYLERSGMTILDRNWNCRSGEVDIVAIDGDALVFVEVKTRKTDSKGTPEEAVSASKQQRYGRIARTYIEKAGLIDPSVRFDVVAIKAISEDRALLRHHRDAFCVA